MATIPFVADRSEETVVDNDALHPRRNSGEHIGHREGVVHRDRLEGLHAGGGRLPERHHGLLEIAR